MKNLLNIILVMSLSCWIFSGMLVPIVHLVDMYFFALPETKEYLLSTMLLGLVVTTPIGLYNLMTGGTPNINLPTMGKQKEGQKPPSCKSCKKKK
jgi:hypothetical protein